MRYPVTVEITGSNPVRAATDSRALKYWMFQDVQEYIKLSREERTAHLNLSEECIEIGGGDSRHYRGLLAHFLKTTIPSGMKIHLCHACNVHGCSNPRHLYWGTAGENAADTRKNGKWTSPYLLTKAKYGEEQFKEILKAAATKGGKAVRKKKIAA